GRAAAYRARLWAVGSCGDWPAPARRRAAGGRRGVETGVGGPTAQVAAPLTLTHAKCQCHANRNGVKSCPSSGVAPQTRRARPRCAASHAPTAG
ncbi:hypothetical protein THAOC_37803, partial [Thalassiosira oceanica]